jgi:hypothetical protein
MAIRFGDSLNSVTTTTLTVLSSITAPALISTRAFIATTSIPSDVTFIRTAGYVTAGDGGEALYAKKISEPAHPGKVQSMDGAWWEIADTKLEPRQFGVVYGSGSDQNTEAQNFITTCVALGRTGRVNGIIRANSLTASGRLVLIGTNSQISKFITSSTTANILTITTQVFGVGCLIEHIGFESPSNATQGAQLILQSVSSFGMQQPQVISCSFNGGYVGLDARASLYGTFTDNFFNNQVDTQMRMANTGFTRSATQIARNTFIGRYEAPNQFITNCGLQALSGDFLWVTKNWFFYHKNSIEFKPVNNGLFNLQISENAIQGSDRGIYLNVKDANEGVPTANAPVANIDISSNNIQSLSCIVTNGLVTNGQITSNMLFPTTSGFGVVGELNGWTIVGNTIDGTLPNIPLSASLTTGIRLFGETYQIRISENVFSGVLYPYTWGVNNPRNASVTIGTASTGQIYLTTAEFENWRNVVSILAPRGADASAPTAYAEINATGAVYSATVFNETVYITASAGPLLAINQNATRIANNISEGSVVTLNLRPWDTFAITYADGDAPGISVYRHRH